MVRDTGLPAYAETLAAQHAAFESELAAMLQSLCSAMSLIRVADLACGDGFFTRLLASNFTGSDVVGIDSDEAYLQAAREATGVAEKVQYVRADVLDPPPSLGRFALVFCADSFQTIEDHDRLIANAARLCETGGWALVTETDSVHDLICPWPLAVERKLRELEARTLSRKDERGYAFPRYAMDLFARHGFEDVRVRSFTFDRNGPFDELTARWLALELRDRLERVYAAASADERRQLSRYLSEDGDDYIGAGELCYVTYLRYAILGKVRG